MNWRFREYGWRLLPGGIVSVAIAILLKLGALQPLEHLSYGALFRLRGEIPWDDRIVIVAIDDASIKQLGRFPWSREQYVKLLKVLSQADPSVVTIDLIWAEPSPADAKLAEAMMQQGRVVLAQTWDSIGLPLQPLPDLQAAAIARGHILQRQDTDGLTRKMDLQIEGEPALAVATLQAYTLAQASIPLPNLDQPLWINWPSSAQRIQQYAFADVIQGRINAAAFQNKIILVGVTATAIDALVTPFDRSPPASGVYLHAAVINTLLKNNALRVFNDQGQLLLILCGGLCLSLVIPRRRVSQQLLVWSGFCLVWAIASIFLFQANYWLPLATPILLFSLTGGAVALHEQFKTKALLQQSEERYALAANGANDGLWDWNLETNEVYFSPRWKAMLGYRDHEIQHISDEWFQRLHPDDWESLKAAIATHFAGLVSHFQSEHRMLHKDGSYRWMLCRGLAVRRLDGKAIRMAGSQTDITKRKKAEEQLLYDAFHDGLTNLSNRALFMDRVKHALELARRKQNYLFAVIFLDLDRFKVVNDSLGHMIGDQLLIQFARKLSLCLRSGDTVARFGGDEFAILLDDISGLEDATAMADQIQKELQVPFLLNGHEVFTTVSIGIVLNTTEDQLAEELLRNADLAMYRAKNLGKGQYQVFQPSMHVGAITRLQIENDLRRAIERQEFQLHYQPIVSLETGSLLGFESLIRWIHPEHGNISPVEFIPVAEETGLIIPIGVWVIREACQQMQNWQARFPSDVSLTVSVNLSSKQFSQANLVQQITAVLTEMDLPAQSLKLEITESVIMENPEAAANMLFQLKKLGVQIYIDDFGTGYSSLSYLHNFPFDALKIDRSFISRMDDDGEGMTIVQSIITLAENLGIHIVAEGVETVEQMKLLRVMGGTNGQGQGFLFSKPLSSQAAEILIEEHFALPQSGQLTSINHHAIAQKLLQSPDDSA